jgi:hypothetical protein
MNEGENTGMSNGPIFSSPNIAGSQPQPQQAPVPMPEQPTDITKIGNPALTTTVAAMPEQDGPAKPAVMSGGDPIDKKKPRFGFTTRRFKDRTQAPAAPVMQAADTPAFANAPEFFNNAVGDIVTADAAATEKQNKTKKAVIVGAIIAAAVVLVGVVCVIALPKVISEGQKQQKNSISNRLKNIIVNGEDKSDEITEPLAEKISDYYGYFIYKDAIAGEDGCKKTNEMVTAVAEGNDLGSIPEIVSDICADMGYQMISRYEMARSVNIFTDEELKYYVDSYYDSRSNHREAIESLRISQGHSTADIVLGLVGAGCVVNGRVDLPCEDRYSETEQYKAAQTIVNNYEMEYQIKILSELSELIEIIDKGGVNDQE